MDTGVKNLEVLNLSGDLGKVYEGILEACKEIAEHLRYSTVVFRRPIKNKFTV